MAIFSPSGAPSNLPSSASPSQIKLRFACVQAIKEWSRVFTGFQAVQYVGLSFAAGFQFVTHLFDPFQEYLCVLTISHRVIRSLAALLYLSAIDQPGWSRELVQSEVNALEILDSFIAGLGQASTELNLGEHDILCKQRGFYQSVRATWAARLQVGVQGGENLAESGNPLVTSTATAAPTMDFASLEDTSIQDIFDWTIFDNEWFAGLPAAAGFSLES
jgi:hypothetical protein